MSRIDRRSWIELLERDAMSSLVGTPLDAAEGADQASREAFVAEFRDESGHRRRVDRPLLAFMTGVMAGRPDPHASADVRLWWMLHDPTIDPFSVISRGLGPLISADDAAIETWTESELCALHALSRLALVRSSDALADRCSRAAEWLIANIQPDNATNHAWAVHVFVELAATGDDEAMLYAQTLMHNCRVQLGRPDRFSALLLLDAARSLEGRER